VKGILFESPIHIEISAGNDVPLTSLTQPLLPTQPIIPYLAVENEVPVTSAPPTVPSQKSLIDFSEPLSPQQPVPASAPILEPEPEALHYTMVKQKDVNRKKTRHLWSYIGKTFAETDENGGFVCLQRIVDVVATKAHPLTFYFKYYNPEKPQLFGIDNYYNGNNAVYMVYYDGIVDNFHYDNSFWWDGLSSFYGREKYKYCGGIMGINRTSLELYDDIIENYIHDEGQMEEFILSKPNMDKFTSKESFYLNIKTMNNSEINTMHSLFMHLKHNLLNFNELSENFQKKVIDECNIFLQIPV
jgi:hypothetical protein